MLLSASAVIAGLAALVWSAELFVDAAAALARRLGIAPLVVGMVVVGFGTSAPEMLVSAVSAWQGSPGIALGNAYGSNLANIGLIVGLVALLAPIAVHSRVLRRELPLLGAATLLSALLLLDGTLSRVDAALLALVFVGSLWWTVVIARKGAGDPLLKELADELPSAPAGGLARVLGRLLVGLAVLLIASRLLVWGAVDIAAALGVSDLVIGLTVVAVGTSLPELASSLVSARRGAHDLALGNVVGSNLFNTLAVVALAAGIAPIAVPTEVLGRDLPLMAAFTVALLLMGIGLGGRQGRINRLEGAALLLAWLLYNGWLVLGALG